MSTSKKDDNVLMSNSDCSDLHCRPCKALMLSNSKGYSNELLPAAVILIADLTKPWCCQRVIIMSFCQQQWSSLQTQAWPQAQWPCRGWQMGRWPHLQAWTHRWWHGDCSSCVRRSRKNWGSSQGLAVPPTASVLVWLAWETHQVGWNIKWW